jgi:hypothetical protein
MPTPGWGTAKLGSAEELPQNDTLYPTLFRRLGYAASAKRSALDWLEEAATTAQSISSSPNGAVRTDYAWDTLEDEPRYWQLCDRLGLGKDQWPRKERLP